MEAPVKKSSENLRPADKAPLMSVSDTKQFMGYVNTPKTHILSPNTKQRISDVKQEAIESLKEKGVKGGKTRRRSRKHKQTKKRRHH